MSQKREDLNCTMTETWNLTQHRLSPPICLGAVDPLCVFPLLPHIITCILAFILPAHFSLFVCSGYCWWMWDIYCRYNGSRLLTWAPTIHVHSFPNLISCVAYQTVEVCLPNLSLIFVCLTLVMIQASDKVYRSLYHKMATGSHFSIPFNDSYI
jgi:hypothetical protein